MCGIVGYIGERQASEVLLNGLKKLEYRGYDSAGIAVYSENSLNVQKYKGRIHVLEEKLKNNPLRGNSGVGHTRWATHGAPSDENSHPHTNGDSTISIVHNGIIENYVTLKNELIEKGYVFKSQTDTEVIVHLIDSYYKGDIYDAVINSAKRLKGAYALVVVCAHEPERLIAVRKDSPLVIGLGDGENFIASDIPALLEYTKHVYLLDNGTFAIVTKDSVTLTDGDKKPIHKDVFEVTWSLDDANKGGYKHFMLKEIYEQPTAVVNTLRGRLDASGIHLDDFKLTKAQYDNIDRIYIVACGTAYYAGCVGKNLIEKYTRKPVEMSIASEFRYMNPIVNEKTLFIAISQSGETADTLASMRLAKSRHARVLAITNVVGSSVSREADDIIYTQAGPEIAVASTKAYSTQVVCMYLLALKFAALGGQCEETDILALQSACLNIHMNAEKALDLSDQVKKLASYFKNAQDAFFIGRGLDYCLALEGALKMKEISYIHVEAYQAGELKHGPIALLEEGTLLVALCTQKGELLEKTLSNIKEAKARGAKVLAIAQMSSKEEVEECCDFALYIKDTMNDTTVIPAVILLQLLAYYVASLRGCDVDKPRNLAKSVTVE
jgi:glucosamine--fructose-6-phosphate aminotransferase (isomerizing)